MRRPVEVFLNVAATLDMAANVLRDPGMPMDLDALRPILDAVPHPIFVKDERYRLVVANRSLCDLVGRSPDELLGRTDQDFMAKERADALECDDRLVLDTGQINVREEFFARPDGGSRTLVIRKRRVCL